MHFYKKKVVFRKTVQWCNRSVLGKVSLEGSTVELPLKPKTIKNFRSFFGIALIHHNELFDNFVFEFSITT